MDYPRNDTLDKIGKFIGFKQMILFTVLLLYTCHVTYNSFSCPICGMNAPLICKLFMGILFLVITIMFILSFLLSLGISMRQADFLRPWLFTNMLMILLCFVMLVLTTEVLQIILGALVLIFQGISWYPIYKLYRRYCAECKARDEDNVRSENYLFSGIESTAGPYYQDVDIYSNRIPYGEPPPSYDQAMGNETPPPHFTDIQNFVNVPL
ncbi:uncharacterized protein LOC142239234 isoform X2 [Haematobia irritans]|uniref:uncharacterized protein LOC142239234 isoform X2 n=1 Tax=Haematobia irritans TaxID=7368 RepID=UPI003F4F8293